MNIPGVSDNVQVPVERKPIVIRSLVPRTEDEMLKFRSRMAVLGWPVIVLDCQWEVMT